MNETKTSQQEKPMKTQNLILGSLTPKTRKLLGRSLMLALLALVLQGCATGRSGYFGYSAQYPQSSMVAGHDRPTQQEQARGIPVFTKVW